jgi:hypothetical protein
MRVLPCMDQAQRATKISVSVPPPPPVVADEPPAPVLSEWMRECADACDACASICGEASLPLEAHIPKPLPRLFTNLEEAATGARNCGLMLRRGSRYAAQACTLAAESCERLAQALTEYESEEPVAGRCAAACLQAAKTCRVVASRELRRAAGLAG